MQENQLHKLMAELKNAGAQKNVSDQTMQDAVSGLSDGQKTKMDALLREPEKLKALLDSPIAKKIMSELKDQ